MVNDSFNAFFFTFLFLAVNTMPAHSYAQIQLASRKQVRTPFVSSGSDMHFKIINDQFVLASKGFFFNI